MIAHVSDLASATDLPVSADLENGFADDPASVADTIRHAAEVGAVGGSIEDATTRTEDPIYERELAVDRIRAAVEAARGLSFSFMLTARAENYLVGRIDLADTIERLQAYQDAGADVLYAPGLTDPDEIAAVVRAVDRPVNVLMGLRGVRLSRERLAGMGVKRVSVGSALARTALAAFLKAAREMQEYGTFTFANEAVNFHVVSALFDDD